MERASKGEVWHGPHVERIDFVRLVLMFVLNLLLALVHDLT